MIEYKLRHLNSWEIQKRACSKVFQQKRSYIFLNTPGLVFFSKSDLIKTDVDTVLTDHLIKWVF